MAQHDYNIANQSGSAFRADLNNALQAIVSNNSGASAPSTTYAHQIWIDSSTTPATIKRRDASNASWITLGAVDGSIPAGTAAAPSLFFTGSTTGLYLAGINQLALATAGTPRLVVDASGNINIDSNGVYYDKTNKRLGIGTGSPSRQFSLSDTNPTATFRSTSTTGQCTLFFGDSDSDARGAITYENNGDKLGLWSAGGQKLTIDSSGNVGIGSSNPQTLLHLSNTAQQRFNCLSTANAISFWKDGTPTFAAEVGIGSATGITSTMKFDIYNGSAWNTAMTIDSSSRVGIGSTSPQGILEVKKGGASTTPNLVLTSGGAGDPSSVDPSIQFSASGAESIGTTKILSTGSYGLRALAFHTGSDGAGTERARIDSSGRLLVGTSTSRTIAGDQASIQLETAGISRASLTTNAASTAGAFLNIAKSRGTSLNSKTVVASGDDIGGINFFGADGTNDVQAAAITAAIDGTPGTNDMPGRLVFSTTADGASSPTERMRIGNGGQIMVGTTDTNGNTFSTSAASGLSLNPNNGQFTNCANGAPAAYFNRTSSDGSILVFNRNGTEVGKVQVTTTATSYVTSSDYRLKENVAPIADGIARLQQLNPSRFNFIAEPNTKVDGFIAHEVQEIVPEAITGTKDEVDADGKPVYQGIDQSKLVPLLTAALQEAVAKIESLEARLTAAGI